VRNRSLIIVTISLATLLATQCTYRIPPTTQYRFILPDNYIGWVRIDFGVTSAPDWRSLSNSTTTVTIPETGVEQTGSPFPSTPGEGTEGTEVLLYYQRGDDLVPVPDYLYSHTLFMSTLVQPFKLPQNSRAPRKGSWYFFVGPASLRGRFPPRGVLHHGAKVPTPGRITVPEAKPQLSP
jgi:hypothetical protein